MSNFRGFHKNENGQQKVFVNGEWITGEWVYGNHLFDDVSGKHYIVPFGNITESEKVGQDGCCYCVGFEVIPETVGQYTGLQDANHRKIFEYDLIVFGFSPCVVRYDVKNARFMLYEDNKYLKNGFNSDTMEFYTVRGTVFDI